MDFFEAIEKRKSIRQFKPELFPDAHIEKALQAALLAPNSSNTQTWDFYWVKSEEMKAKVRFCAMNQSASRTASQLIVVTANYKNWRRSFKPLNDFVQSINAPKAVLFYYKKLIPFTYRAGLLTPIKWVMTTFAGLFRPVPRVRSLNEVAIKSAALAAENFVLAITALGGATCMMEGFDEWRLKRALKLSCSTRIVMLIGVGYESERGTWGPRFRLPSEQVIHHV